MVSVHAKLHVQACFQLEVGQTLPGESTVNKIKRDSSKHSVRRGISRPLSESSTFSLSRQCPPTFAEQTPRAIDIRYFGSTDRAELCSHGSETQTESVPSVSS